MDLVRVNADYRTYTEKDYIPLNFYFLLGITNEMSQR